MSVRYAHTLLFTCPDCSLPMAISLIRDEKTLEMVDGQTHHVECRYCKTASELPGVTAKTHWVNEWTANGHGPSDK
jgi:hypothetical protein